MKRHATMSQIVNGTTADIAALHGVCAACNGTGYDPCNGDGLCLCKRGDELRQERQARNEERKMWTRTKQ